MRILKKRPPDIWVSGVVAAAGSSDRMDGLDKQMCLIDGIPAVVRSVMALSECARVREIIVVCRGDKIADYYDMARFYNLERVTSVVAGGDNRQVSVFAGIRACREEAEYFAIHDGARPLVLPEDIDRCIDSAVVTGASAVGVPVKDTIKVCGENGVIISTPRRDTLWAVQTPQIFESGLYRRAMALAERRGESYTDDCQLVERAGHNVVISPGGHDNIKLTTPEDIAMARAILDMRQNGMPE